MHHHTNFGKAHLWNILVYAIFGVVAANTIDYEEVIGFS